MALDAYAFFGDHGRECRVSTQSTSCAIVLFTVNLLCTWLPGTSQDTTVRLKDACCAVDALPRLTAMSLGCNNTSTVRCNTKTRRVKKRNAPPDKKAPSTPCHLEVQKTCKLKHHLDNSCKGTRNTQKDRYPFYRAR